MKVFNIIVLIVGVAIIIFNITKLDFEDLLSEDSQVALITILASACAILLMQILMISKKIEKKAK